MTKEEIIEEINLVQQSAISLKAQLMDTNSLLKDSFSRLRTLKSMLRNIEIASNRREKNHLTSLITTQTRTKRGNYSPELVQILEKGIYQIGLYELNINERLLTLNNEKKHLTIKEIQLLAVLAVNANKLLTRAYMLNTIWSEDSYFSGRSMDVYLCKLRKILQDDETINIVNYHGKGYKLSIM